ncbi:MAG: D-tyrosyl-tRNA(Tyr) deacylase [Candidatus Eisenbacteria bacterium]|nr:D-tyrosyl-tRNA(Tyr) deacylase [Candidatus Eisenbacteria bacterium]
MIAAVQRVSRAEVRVDGEATGRIGAGLVVLLGVAVGDTDADVEWLASKCANLRIFADDKRLMNRSVLEVGGGALVVSQFTLLGDTRRGRRPGFERAAPPETAERLYEEFCARLGQLGVPVERGRFRAHMEVELVNDGPVTLILDSREARP